MVKPDGNTPGSDIHRHSIPTYQRSGVVHLDSPSVYHFNCKRMERSLPRERV